MKEYKDGKYEVYEWPNGSKKWSYNGKWHRENDLPAIDEITGHKEWWLNGKRHRENDYLP